MRNSLLVAGLSVATLLFPGCKKEKKQDCFRAYNLADVQEACSDLTKECDLTEARSEILQKFQACKKILGCQL